MVTVCDLSTPVGHKASANPHADTMITQVRGLTIKLGTERSRRPRRPRRTPNRHHNVLVIESSDITRLLIRRTVEHHGHQPATFATAQGAQDWLREFIPDMVFLEHTESNAALIRWIRLGSWPIHKVPIFALSRVDDLMRQGPPDGVDAVILKPMRIEAFVRLMSAVRPCHESGL